MQRYATYRSVGLIQLINVDFHKGRHAKRCLHGDIHQFHIGEFPSERHSCMCWHGPGEDDYTTLFYSEEQRERERAAHINEPSGDEATTIEG